MSITSKRYDRPFLTSGNKPQSSFICKFEGRGNRRTHCTKCWSNLTLKCNVNTFVKTDAQIREECRRTISYLQGYSCPKLYCKKLTNQKPTVNAVPTPIQEEQLHAECGARLKNFHSWNLLCICLSLFETNPNNLNIFLKLHLFY